MGRDKIGLIMEIAEKKKMFEELRGLVEEIKESAHKPYITIRIEDSMSQHTLMKRKTTSRVLVTLAERYLREEGEELRALLDTLTIKGDDVNAD